MIMMTRLMMMTTMTKTKREHVTEGTIGLRLIKAQIFLVLYDDGDNFLFYFLAVVVLAEVVMAAVVTLEEGIGEVVVEVAVVEEKREKLWMERVPLPKYDG